MKNLEKEKKIKSEISKLNKIFKDLSENKKKLCESLIQNAAFMAVTLEELQATIKEEGPVMRHTNGNGFEVLQEHPAQKTYNTMINRYASVIKQMSDMLPDNKTESMNSAGEALAAFVAKGKPGGK